MPSGAALASAVPGGKGALLWQAALPLGLLAPTFGFIPDTLRLLPLGVAPGLLDAASGAVLLCFAPFLVAKWHALHPKAAGLGIRIGNSRGDSMRFTDTDLRNGGTLITGSTGGGKTSRLLLPIFEQLLAVYSADDATSPRARAGGILLEVKSNFAEFGIALLDGQGRWPAAEVKIVRGNCLEVLVEFADERGRRFFLNGQPASSGCAAQQLYAGRTFRDGTRVSDEVFGRIALSSESLWEQRAGELAAWDIPVDPAQVPFVGWRYAGGHLARVAVNTGRRQARLTGEQIPPPRTLRFRAAHGLDNGVHFNLVSKRSAAEAAARLAVLARMTSGEGKDGGGENAFFYQSAQRLIALAIRLSQALRPDVEVTVPDIHKIVANEAYLEGQLRLLQEKTRAARATAARATAAGQPTEAQRWTLEVDELEQLALSFSEDWQKQRSDKTGQSILSTLKNLFGPFANDQILARAFCVPSTLDLRDTYERGTWVFVAPGEQYETLQRTIGAAIKMEFQTVLLARVGRKGTDNQNRRVISIEDECWQYIISAGQDAGDPRFHSLSRESNVINLRALQGLSWVKSSVGAADAAVWSQSFTNRIWLNCLDHETNEDASNLSGQIKGRKELKAKSLRLSDLVGQGGNASLRTEHQWENRKRFEPHVFAHLDADEFIAFNKGEQGSHDKVRRGRLDFTRLTSDAGIRTVAEAVGWYFREAWEQRLAQSGRWDWIDPLGRSSSAIPHRPADLPPGPAAPSAPLSPTASASPPPARPAPFVPAEAPPERRPPRSASVEAPARSPFIALSPAASTGIRPPAAPVTARTATPPPPADPPALPPPPHLPAPHPTPQQPDPPSTADDNGPAAAPPAKRAARLPTSGAELPPATTAQHVEAARQIFAAARVSNPFGSLAATGGGTAAAVKAARDHGDARKAAAILSTGAGGRAAGAADLLAASAGVALPALSSADEDLEKAPAPGAGAMESLAQLAAAFRTAPPPPAKRL